MGPAERMEGLTLAGGWTVGKQIGSSHSRSARYHVTGPKGERAFLKALDFFRAYEAKDTLAAMDDIISSIRHERDLIEMCGESKMSRIVRGLAYGDIRLEENEHAVWYLIFELAEGDVRHELAKIDPNEQAWRLRTLHQAAVGLTQMHRRGLCHQNVKPSHLLAFGELGVKIGDLSTTSRDGMPAPLFDADSPGDPIYAPPESLYDFRHGQGLERRARDMYLFGSLISFVYLEITTTTALLKSLPGPWHPREAGTSFEEALPYLDDAFDVVVQELRESAAPPALVEAFRELCSPDPRRRGHPRTHAERHGSRYSLERYVTLLDLELSRTRGQGIEGCRAA